MKILLIFILLISISCSFKNEHGKCVGIVGDKSEKLEYEVSIWNAFWTLIVTPSFIPPALWAMYCVECPVGPKEAESP